MHDVLSVAITIATILVSTYFSHSAINSLRADLHGDVNSMRGEINSLRSDMMSKLDSIQRDMREFYAEQARHITRVTALERAATDRR